MILAASFRRDLYMKLGKWLAENYDIVIMEDFKASKLIGELNRLLRGG